MVQCLCYDEFILADNILTLVIVSRMYGGKSFSRRVGYIVYPGGGDMHPSKENILTVAMGLQDTRGVLFDVKLRELVSSLTFVQDCPRE